MKLASIEAIVRALNGADVPFLVVGGLAVVAHGYGRQTIDLDVVIRLDADVVHRAFQALESLGYRPRVPITADGLSDATQRIQWIEEKGMTVLNFHSDEHGETPIDILVAEPFDFGDEFHSALVQELAAGVPVRFVRLRTLLAMKVRAGRPQDLADIAELRLANPEESDA